MNYLEQFLTPGINLLFFDVFLSLELYGLINFFKIAFIAAPNIWGRSGATALLK